MNKINFPSIKKKLLGDLVPYAKNARTHTEEQIAQIAASIKEFGWTNPILLDGENGIIAGHGRLFAAMKLGIAKVPCIELSHLTETQKQAYILADNRLAELAGWDDDLLRLELGELDSAGFDLDLIGFGDFDLSAINPEAAPEAEVDRAEELQKEWGTETGQVWQVGRHRVMCGDSTSEGDVGRLLDGAEPVLMVTDPPYGISVDATWRDQVGYRLGRAQTGKLALDDGFDWLLALNVVPCDVAYVWHHHIFGGVVFDALVECGFSVRQQLIWAKTVHSLTMSAYQQKHEPCWYAVRKNRDALWVGGRDQMSVWELASPKQIMSGSDEEKMPHPTQKPLECMARPIRNHDAPEVYDPFLGSGTTAVAAEQLGRACYGMEIEPKYVAVTLQRLADMGLEPKLLNEQEVHTDAA